MSEKQLDLFPSTGNFTSLKEEPIFLEAYIAIALTGLSQNERDAVFFISDKVAKICEKHFIQAYLPWKKTDPVQNVNISDEEVYFIDRSKVSSSDLFILYCDKPSFGAGQELEIAGGVTVPTILLIKQGKKASRMVTGSIAEKIKVYFSDPDELTEALDNVLNEIRSKLITRRLGFTGTDKVIGKRVKKIRQEKGMTQKYLADRIGVGENFIKMLERNPDRISNPTLEQIRKIAFILDVSPASLMESETSEIGTSNKENKRVILNWAYQYNIGYRDLEEFVAFVARSPKRSKSLTPKECFSLFQRMKKYKR